MHAKSETHTTRKAQHALIFDHYITVQRAHSLFDRPLQDTLQKVGAETESANFVSHDDGELRILAPFVYNRPGNRADTSLFGRQSLDEYQCKSARSIHIGQLACMSRGQLRDWTEKSKSDLFGCQITEAAPQRLGISGQYGSRDELATRLES